jgi:cell wall-associated NlpC family hydrolase
LRARAQQVANELEELEQQSGVLNEQYLELSTELERLEAQQVENRAAVEEAQARVESTRGEAAGYLVEAYIGAGAAEGMALGASDPNEAVNSQVMLEILRSDRDLAADEFAASRSDLEARSAELEASSKELQAAKDRQAEVVAELEASVDRQEALLASTNSDLNAALAAERERREAEAAARAQAAAQAAERQAAASRTAASTAAPRSSSSSSPAASPAPQRPSNAAPAAPSPAPTPPPASAPNGRAAAAVSAALSRLGTPYRWGGTTPAGFDCSGLMLWSWAHAGVSLPRTSGAQRAYTQRISFNQLQPGDLIFSGNPVYHVGMYIGGGQMVHSPQTGDVAKISSVRTGGSTSYGRVP